MQSIPSHQIDGESVSSECVRVWFGAHVLAEYVADPQTAERYAEAMRRRYAGLRVTCEHADSPGTPLPSEPLWGLNP